MHLKTVHYIFCMVVSLLIVSKSLGIGEHLQNPRSPLLKPHEFEKAKTDDGREGVWIPGTYGGVTALRLDLDEIGSDQMLTVYFRGDEENGYPLYGENYKLHSDETTGSGSPSMERRVILVDEESLQRNRKRVICYTVHYKTDTFDERGRPSSSEGTHYKLTLSEIEDDLVVKYLFRFGNSFPNSEYPDRVKPPKVAKASDGAAHVDAVNITGPFHRRTGETDVTGELGP